MTEHQDIYVVWTNTDRTEGRGRQIPIAYCRSKTTAERKAAGQGVMGSDADIQKFVAIKICGHWCAPVTIEQPSRDDEKIDKANAAKAEAIAKAKLLGLTDEDLAALAP